MTIDEVIQLLNAHRFRGVADWQEAYGMIHSPGLGLKLPLPFAQGVAEGIMLGLEAHRCKS